MLVNYLKSGIIHLLTGYYLYIFLFLVLLNHCQSSGKNQWQDPYLQELSFEGWYGPPYNPLSNPREYYYSKYDGQIPMGGEGNGKKNRFLCRQSALQKGQQYLLPRLVFNSFHLVSEVVNPQKNQKKMLDDLKKQEIDVSIKECKSYNTLTGQTWQRCRCVVYVMIPGGSKEILARIKAMATE